MLVNKCLFFFSLQYGTYTWGIISMLVRLGIATIGYKMPVIYNGKANIFIASYSGWLFGWYLGTALIIAVALKGIAEKRHILIYPYIVVVVTEMVIIVGLTIYYVFAVGPLLKDISVIGVILINSYFLICLISMYQSVGEIRKNTKHYNKLTNSV